MRKILLSIAILAGLVTQASAADNYNATAGSGLTFGAKDSGGVLYSRFIGCDNTTPSQCWAVDSSGYLSVVVTNTNANGQAVAGSSSPVVVAKNSGTGSTVAGAAIGTAGTASAEVVTVQGVASMTPLLANPGTAANWGVGATASSVPANATYMGFNSGGNLTGPSLSTPLPVRPTDGTNPIVVDPCSAVAKTTKAFTQTATAVLVTGTSAKKTYICSFVIIAGAAEIFNITAGTGSTCGTSTVAVMGTTTAANGLSLAANGGITLGNGAATVGNTTVNADDLCLQQSGSNRLSGSLTYVQL